MGKQSNNDVTIIKKYSNRRLYNTGTSCYITLEDLCDMVKRGEEFEVVDAKTNESLTRSVLTQIIFEQESKGYNLLPVTFLRHLITLYGNNMENVVPGYLDLTMNNFIKNQEKMRNFSSNSWGDLNPISVMENIAKQNMEIFESAFSLFDPLGSVKKDDEKKS